MKILFLCRKNAATSQMAEAFANARSEQDIEIVSAGLDSAPLHPAAIKVMAEVGVDLSKAGPKKLDDLPDTDFDVVITLCRDVVDQLPVLPGFPVTVHWDLNPPGEVVGKEDVVLRAFRQSRDEVKRLVDDFFDRGYQAALQFARECEGMLLDNVSDGIMAHDLDRRIFHFNKAAEEITGYKREEIIGKDCHDVFPGRLCGGKCLFCQDPAPSGPGSVKREIDINTKSGERRTVDSTLRMMSDVDGRDIGVLLSFHDVTRERALARRVGEINQFSGIIGHDQKMLEIYDLIRDLADTDVPVLIQGESGTGKELVAAAIHNEGLRGNKLFVPINCGALPESLLESELFGHVKGSFTGADRDKPGLFQLADGGVIFLDEIGETSPGLQVRLLRVLQEGEIRRVGADTDRKVDVRVIAASHRDLQQHVADGEFREDLFYRLAVFPIPLPPLRDRREDIPDLCLHFLSQKATKQGKGPEGFTAPAMDALCAHEWPGNIRELQNEVERASLFSGDGERIDLEHLSERLTQGRQTVSGPGTKVVREGALKAVLAQVEREMITAALERHEGNRTRASEELQVSRWGLVQKIKSYGLES